eukprot:1858455-Prymnesium_polylepis.1
MPGPSCCPRRPPTRRPEVVVAAEASSASSYRAFPPTSCRQAGNIAHHIGVNGVRTPRLSLRVSEWFCLCIVLRRAYTVRNRWEVVAVLAAPFQSNASGTMPTPTREESQRARPTHECWPSRPTAGTSRRPCVSCRMEGFAHREEGASRQAHTPF